MLKKNLYTCLLLAAVLLLTKLSFGQCTTNPADYNTLDGGNSSVVDGGYACPSLDLDKNGLIDESVTVGAFHEVSSTTVFSVEAVIDGAGDLSKNTFEWAVYGGWITEINGTTPIASQPRTTDNIRYSCLSGFGVVGTNSVITVEWDTTNYIPTNAWVAVRQISEWGCYSGEWRVMTIDLRNDVPQITYLPPHIHLPYDITSSTYTLPLPTATDAPNNCNQDLAYTVKVENPVGTTIFEGTNLTRDVNLRVGDNVVTWTVSDGSRSVSQSYTITVEPNLQILHVATINPFCGSNGTALVTSITDVAGNPYSETIEYSFDGGTNWGSSSAALPAGNHTVQARVVYSVDYDNDGDADPFIHYSPEYNFTLTASATAAVDQIPAAGDGSNVIATSCGDGSDGQISVGTMNAQNHSVAFNGTNYLLLNRSYTGVVTAFSAAAWIKTSSQSGTILSFNNSAFYQIQLNAGRVSLASNPTNPVAPNNFIVVTDSKYMVDNGQWHLVVVTYNAGKYTIYVDGEEAVTTTVSGENSIGEAGVTYFGSVGTVSRIDDFSAPVTDNGFFSGLIAEVGIWDTELLAADVRTMKRKGMATVFATDHWVLNAGPGDISPSSTSVFTDVGNLANQAHWGRFVNNPTRTVDPDSPVLYSWRDNPTDPGTGYTENTNVLSYDRIILNIGDPGLKTGSYELTASDILGCGIVPREFVVPNGDDEPPYFLWNASANKQARQSTTVNDANLASDALLNTSASTDVEATNESWWDVDLGNTYPIGRVQLYPGGTLDNVWVMISDSPFGLASTLAEDQSVGIERVQQITGSVSAGQYVSFPNTNARYVRIRRGAQNAALALNEVVVLTNYPTPELRKLYLTGVGDCDYEITANDAVIDPIPVDACGNPMKSLTYTTSPVITRESNKTLVDEDDGLPLYTQFEATWTAIDENDRPATLKMRYEVVDEEKPVINGNPFAAVDATMSYCFAQTYRFPIPNVTDNLDNCPDKYLQNITLFIDGFPVKLDEPIDVTNYIHETPGTLDKIPDNMQPGTHNFEWRVTDHTGNETISEPYTIYIQKKPELREIRYVPISCSGLNNGAVYFTEMYSENDNIPLPAVITYLLINVADATNVVSSPSPVILTNNPLIIPGATYRASFEINGCRPSSLNYQLITIADPEVIELNPLVNDVLCWGDASGAIDISPSGGNQTSILHLAGSGSEVNAPAYSALDLTSQGMIETWVFLDDLGANGVDNMGAGIFGSLGSYGLKLVDGVPVFYIGDGTTVAAVGSAQLPVRQWVHLAGTFTWDGSVGTATLYVDGSAAGTDALDAAPPAAGGIAMGSLGAGGDADNLRGFVRNARIWNAIPDADAFSTNRYLVSPIDNGHNLVANYPMNAASGANVFNVSNSAANGTVSGTYYRQKFAYYWQNPDNSFLQFEEDITNKVAGTYTVTLCDAAGCVETFTPVIKPADQTPPTMKFFTTRDRGTQLAIGTPIVRYTNNADGALNNVAGNCTYVPYSGHDYPLVDDDPGEFDPDISDGGCNTDFVTLTYQLWDEATGDWGTEVSTPLLNPAKTDKHHVTMNGNTTDLTGIVRARWRAQDLSQSEKVPEEFTEREVTYYIVDNEVPTAIYIDEDNNPLTLESTSHVSVPDDECEYTVPDGALIPKVTDNCPGTGTLTNDYNGKDNLDGEILPVGTYPIKWTYSDRQFPGYNTDPYNTNAPIPYSIEFTHTLIVEDNNPPEVGCKVVPTVFLNSSGAASLNSLDMADNTMSDNCGNISKLVLSRNVAYTISTAAQSGSTGNANLALDHNTGTEALTDADANPWWNINLGGAHTVLALRLYAGVTAPLSNFWVVVANTATFSGLNTGQWTPADTLFDAANVSYAQYFPGTVSGLITLNKAASGQYVWIVMNNATATPLCLAEVEVYGTPNLATADKLNFSCDDIRYSAGTFHPMGVLLSAIDDHNNAGSCMGSVTVADNTPPDIVVNSSPTISLTGASIDLNSAANIALIDAGSNDNCSGTNLTKSITPTNLIDCNYIGNYPVVYHVADEYGVESQRSILITISDDIPPTMTPATGTIELPIGPDGYYDVKVTDLISDWSDNCSQKDKIRFSINPPRVYCDNVGNNIDITITATDENNRSSEIKFLAADKKVMVVDKLAPTFSLSGYTHIIPSSGSKAIFFDDIVRDGNLHDNCTARAELLRYIRYEENMTAPGYDPTDWCGYGNEGGGASAFANLASKASSTTGSSTGLANHPVAYAYDNLPAGTVATADQTYYASSSTSGERTLQYNFAKSYQFESIEALWADVPANDGNIALSHVTTPAPAPYLLDANITASGGTVADKANVHDANNGTSMALQNTAGWIQYTFTQPVMVANVRLRWSAASLLQGDTQIEYENSSGVWTSMGTIANTSVNTSVAVINATYSVTKIRLSYNPVAGNTPAIAEWYVYGKPCTLYYEGVLSPAGATEVLISHNPYKSTYINSTTGSDPVGPWGATLDQLNDANSENDGWLKFYGANDFDSDNKAYVQYNFNTTLALSRTQVWWDHDSNGVPSSAWIEYWDGTAWKTNPSLNFTSLLDDVYSTLNLNINTSKIRLYFTRKSGAPYGTFIYNWRVYGYPCTATLPANVNPPLSRSATIGYSTTNLSLGVACQNTTTIGNIKDGDNATTYSSGTGNKDSYRYIYYDFGSPKYISSTSVNWKTAGRDATIFTCNGSSVPTDEPLWSTNYVNVVARFIILKFRLPNSGKDVEINEWVVDGFDPSGIIFSNCPTIVSTPAYNCPTVTTQIPTILPTTATVQYSNDNGGTWLPATPITVDKFAFPAGGVNKKYLNGVAGAFREANAIKLTFDNPAEGSIGLYEFRANGRRIPQSASDAGACYTYTCADVNTPSVVHLKAIDKSGNPSGDIPVTVAVEPYFNIQQLEIKDCGYDGERYYALATGLDNVAVPYNYIWNEVVDYGENLFKDNSLTTITGLPNGTGYSTGNQSWINFNTGGNVDTRNGYSVSLRLQDNNQCWDSYNYVFDYNAGSTTATSVKEKEACVGNEVTYNIEFPNKFVFCFEGTLVSNWYNEDGFTALADNANFDVISGGTNNSLSVTGKFLTSTSSRGGTKTGIKYGYKIRQLDPYATITSTEVEMKSASTPNQTDNAIIITGDILPGGPYWIPTTGYATDYWGNTYAYTTQYKVSALANGTRFIRTNEIYDYGDYGACEETTMFKTTVYDVVTPIIEATRDIVPNASSTWYEFTGVAATDQANFPICVRDTITYRVKNYAAADFRSLDWDFNSDETTRVPTGRRLDGGNSYDQTIQMVWDIFTKIPAKYPRLTVKGFNKLGCTATTPAVVTHAFTDVTKPVLKGNASAADNDCSALNQVHVNNPNQCGYMFTNLPAPLMTDDCDNRIESYWCGLDVNGDGDTDDAGDIANMGQNAGRFYPVGLHKVIWKARDYSGNVGQCTHDVRVLDTEPPVMGTPPANIEALVADVNCGFTYASVDHDVHPDDYCDANDPYVADHTIATIYKYNSGSGLYDILAPNQPLAPGTSLVGARFDIGTSKVVWTTSDGVDNSLYGTPGQYPTDGNKNSVSFFVTVVDRTAPAVVDYDGNVTSGIKLENITANSDPNEPGATFIIVEPGYTGTPTGNIIYYPGYSYSLVAGTATLNDPNNLLSDNCTADADLFVEFVSRSDKELNLATEFPVGTTTITWRVSDGATPANRTTFTQDVTVSDNQKPELRDDAEFVNKSISYCARTNYHIPIPRSYWDNVQVDRLDYTISSGVSGFIERSASPNFTIGGNAYFTYSFPVADPNLGADFTITWTATDGANLVSDPRAYTIHVEKEPLWGGVNGFTRKEIGCGGASDGGIYIIESSLNFDPGPDTDHPYIPEFSIDDGANYLPKLNWEGLSSNITYNVMMRVNSCTSPDRAEVTFPAPDAYQIRAEGTNNTCAEDELGTVTAIMDQGGGAKGQWLFNGSNSLTVANYADINLTTSGAIEAWVYLDNLNAATIVQKGASPTGYGLLVSNSKFALWVGNSSVLESTYALAAHRWYHVSAWWDASSMNIAVDGATNLTTGPGGYNANTPSTGSLSLGGNFSGILRTVRIWKIPVSGAIPSSAISVASNDMAGYWEINEGGAVTNIVNFKDSDYPATAAAGSWVTNRPQPGFYNWTRNGVAFPLTSDKSNIFLRNLKKGSYEVTFQDPYFCPATGIKTLYNVLATDNELPEISFLGGKTSPLPVNADLDVCAYKFDGKVLTNDPYTDALLPAAPIITDVAYYTPIVDDANDCDYTITWQVIQVDGNSSTWTGTITDPSDLGGRINTMEVTREVTNGSNRVRVTVAQNDMTLDPPFEYYILVNDAEIPVANGKTTEVTSLDLDNTPGGLGKVTYYAWQFDGGSSDNCTKILKDMNPQFAYEDPVANPSTPWYSSVDLGCSAIDELVRLYYRVSDQATPPNISVPVSMDAAIPVQDVHRPVFYSTFVQHEAVCALYDDADALPAYTSYPVSALTIVEGTAANGWKDYTDNCGVKNIQYKLVNTTCGGCGTVWKDDIFDGATKTSSIDSNEKFYVGTTEVWYRLTDMDSPKTDADWSAQVMFKVVVLPQPTPGTTAPVSGGTTGIN